MEEKKAADIVHQCRSRLTVIRSTAELLLADCCVGASPESEAFVAIIESADSIEELLSQLDWTLKLRG